MKLIIARVVFVLMSGPEIFWTTKVGLLDRIKNTSGILKEVLKHLSSRGKNVRSLRRYSPGDASS